MGRLLNCRYSCSPIPVASLDHRPVDAGPQETIDRLQPPLALAFDPALALALAVPLFGNHSHLVTPFLAQPLAARHQLASCRRAAQ